MIKKIAVKGIHEVYDLAENSIEFNAMISLYDPDMIIDCIMLQNKIIRTGKDGQSCEFFVHPMQDTMEQVLMGTKPISDEKFEAVFKTGSMSCDPGPHPDLNKVGILINRLREVVKSDKQYNLMIHCYAGISRSTAAAVILLYLNGYEESAAIRAVEETRPPAWPSSLILRLADVILGSKLYPAMAEWKEEQKERPFDSCRQDKPLELN